MSDVNGSSIINDENDDILINKEINDDVDGISDNNSLKLNEKCEEELDTTIDNLFKKHVLHQTDCDSFFSETSNDFNTDSSENVVTAKLDTMYEDFTAFKLHVMKEFLFLKHLMENNGKMTESDINPVYKRLAAENESLKKENEKLKQWIDSLFDKAIVSKDIDEK